MKKPLMVQNRYKQGGFTLFELLISLVLVLVLLVSVQRYIGSVTIDQEGISEQRDQATQLRITLSNMQHDVAQAGFIPYSSHSTFNQPVGIFVTSDTLKVASYQPKATAQDCNGTSQQLVENPTGWVYVENSYRLSGQALACDGNGGDIGAKGAVDDIEQILFTDVSSENTRLINVCVITRSEQMGIGGVTTSTMCDNTTPTPNTAHTIYYKTRVDMPVYATSFGAGQ